jgi:hypothetical protein
MRTVTLVHVPSTDWSSSEGFGPACRQFQVRPADALRDYCCLLLPCGISKSFVKSEKAGIQVVRDGSWERHGDRRIRFVAACYPD